MKKSLVVAAVFASILLTTGIASASHWGFSVVLPPVGVYAAPAAPPPAYSPPPYYAPGYRTWVPGHWEDRWTPYGYRRAWVPGFWAYNRY